MLQRIGSWQFLFCFSMVFGNFLHLYQPNKIENNESTQYWLWRDRDGALIPSGAKKRLLLAVRFLYLYFFKLRDPLFLRPWWSPGSLICSGSMGKSNGQHGYYHQVWQFPELCYSTNELGKIDTYRASSATRRMTLSKMLPNISQLNQEGFKQQATLTGIFEVWKSIFPMPSFRWAMLPAFASPDGTLGWFFQAPEGLRAVVGAMTPLRRRPERFRGRTNSLQRKLANRWSQRGLFHERAGARFQGAKGSAAISLKLLSALLSCSVKCHSYTLAQCLATKHAAYHEINLAADRWWATSKQPQVVHGRSPKTKAPGWVLPQDGAPQLCLLVINHYKSINYI